MKKILMSILVFISLTCCADNLIDEMTNKFLENHLGLSLQEVTKKTIITEEIFLKLLLETSDSAEAFKDLNVLWPYKFDTFYDSLYFSIDNTKSTGFVRFFGGDTTWYNIGYFSNSKKDSTWVVKRPSYKEIKKYKLGKKNGEWCSYYPNGQMAYKKEWKMNKIVDTVYNWYPTGIIQEFEVWKDGESVHHECFDENGKKIECEYD